MPIDGLDELRTALQGVATTLAGEALQQCTQAAAQHILDQALQRVPVLRGDVHDLLGLLSHHGATTATTAVQVAQSGPGGVAHEAIFLEYGTQNMPAQPFMRPAFEAAKAAALQAFADTLETNLRQHQ